MPKYHRLIIRFYLSLSTSQSKSLTPNDAITPKEELHEGNRLLWDDFFPSRHVLFDFRLAFSFKAEKTKQNSHVSRFGSLFPLIAQQLLLARSTRKSPSARHIHQLIPKAEKPENAPARLFVYYCVIVVGTTK